MMDRYPRVYKKVGNTSGITSEQESYILEKLVLQLERNNRIQARKIAPLRCQPRNLPPSRHEATDARSSNSSVSSPNQDVQDLFRKLVASGLISSTHKENLPESNKESESVRPLERAGFIPGKKGSILNNSNLDNLRLTSFDNLNYRQNSLYDILHSGKQCSSCSMRFSPQASVEYDRHLDWHFQQNRKLKQKSNNTSSRMWYISTSGWINHGNSGSSQENSNSFLDKDISENITKEKKNGVVISTVKADSRSAAEVCEVCKDEFEYFFNDEDEEWQLKNAIGVLGKKFHPMCYNDSSDKKQDFGLL